MFLSTRTLVQRFPRPLLSRGFSTLPPPSAELQQVLDGIKQQQMTAIEQWGFADCQLTLETSEKLSYLDRNPPNSTHTLLCLHGMTQDRKLFAPFAAALRLPPNVRVIIPDLQGHGSRIPHCLLLGEDFLGHTHEERAADITQFVAALDIATVDVYGYSMGGGVALALASDHPHLVDKCALLAPAGGLTSAAIAETNDGVIRYNYQTVEQAKMMMEVTGFHAEVAKARAPLLAYARAESGVDGEYWARMWSGTVNGIVNIGLSIEVRARAKREYLLANSIWTSLKRKNALVGGSERTASSKRHAKSAWS